ncbi:receptor-type tyrosine-protein phosphatase alpha-like [Dysidea avara]|uniref:receptor-type tyrosine-protein phosphatase alpha-like n=1 Tax=Dysidea avara TaxID=196820 RepID=UPI00331CC558
MASDEGTRSHLEPQHIPLSDFPEYVTEMLKGRKLREQYEHLWRVGVDQPMIASTSEENWHKNRYINVFAYDHCRVKLSQISGVGGSDYINANYLPGYKSKQEYIATQGPLDRTVDDFWRMIWEQNVHTIVMVIQFMEHGRVKCSQYWKEAKPAQYGGVSVRLQSAEKGIYWTYREFVITKDKTDRVIKHYQLTSQWPDYDVPDSTGPVLEFVKFVRSKEGPFKEENGPILVHCGGGVGRTGTFIALDILLQHIKDHDWVDVFGLVCEMRRHRNRMVETESQYIFTHQALVDIDFLIVIAIMSSGVQPTFSRSPLESQQIPLSKFPAYVNDMMKGRKLLQQYELVWEIGVDETVTASTAKENYHKNRYIDLFAYDHGRVKLSPVAGVAGSDYINANYLPGYKSKQEYIATQGPLDRTVDDFWRMIWEQNVHTIVMVINLEHGGWYIPVQYWDDKTPVQYGGVSITVRSAEKDMYWTYREFVITKDKTDRVIKHYQLTSQWPDYDVPDSTGPVLEFVKFVRSKEGPFKEENGPTLVHCGGGVGRTGSFIALDILLQHIKDHDWVDVFGLVCEMRRHRMRMVETEEQYFFVHKLLVDVITAKT